MANSPFADAEPEPLTLANLTTKSLTRAIGALAVCHRRHSAACGFRSAAVSRRYSAGTDCAAAIVGARHVEQELLHVPGTGRTALGAQAAVQADVLVLHHHAAGLERAGHVEVLRAVVGRRPQPRRADPSSSPLAVKLMQSIGQMSTQASHSMHSLSANTVCTSQLRQRCASATGELRVEAQLDLDLDVLQRDLRLLQRHAEAVSPARSRCRSSTRGCPSSARRGSRAAAGACAMSSPRQRRSIEIAASWPCATAQMMFFGPNAASPPKNTPARVDAIVALSTHRHPVLVELDAEVALDPRKRVLLADRDQHVVARESGRRARRSAASLRRPLSSCCAATFSNDDAGQLAVLVRERLRHEVVVDRDALVHRVFLLPRRRLHLVEAGAHDDLHVLAAQAPRAAAAVHRGVAAAEHDDALADLRRCGRTRRSRASRCRCGCSPPLRGVPACRCRGRAARRCRRRRRRSARRAAPSGCRCACRDGIRRRGRGCSPLPRRSPIPAGGTCGIWLRIMPPARASPSKTTHS